MTEEEWLTAGPRKPRLLAVACCNHVRDLLWAGDISRRAVDVAELHADGKISDGKLAEVSQAIPPQLELYPGEPIYDASYWACSQDIQADVQRCLFYAANVSTKPITGSGTDEVAKQVRDAELGHQHLLLECLLGDSSQARSFHTRWRTETAVALASAIYDGRHFDRFPVLADALEDAGCDAAELLAHLRGPGPHARGCWAVDSVLGRE